MKKLLIAGILCLLGIAGLPAFAQHQIDSVFILVDLMDDGSARVRERRDCQMSEQGTEGYITFNNMGDIELKDLQVFDEEGVDYEVEEEWNVEEDGTLWLSPHLRRLGGLLGYRQGRKAPILHFLHADEPGEVLRRL